MRNLRKDEVRLTKTRGPDDGSTVDLEVVVGTLRETDRRDHPEDKGC